MLPKKKNTHGLKMWKSCLLFKDFLKWRTNSKQMYFRTEPAQCSRDLFCSKRPQEGSEWCWVLTPCDPSTDSDNQREMKYDNDCRTIDVLREQRQQGVPAEKSQQQWQERDYSHSWKKTIRVAAKVSVPPKVHTPSCGEEGWSWSGAPARRTTES